AGSAELRLWLWNRARSFVFSTGLSPVVAAAAERAVARVRAEPGLAERVAARAGQLRGGLRGRDLLGHGHIVPWKSGGAPGGAGGEPRPRGARVLRPGDPSAFGSGRDRADPPHGHGPAHGRRGRAPR